MGGDSIQVNDKLVAVNRLGAGEVDDRGGEVHGQGGGRVNGSSAGGAGEQREGNAVQGDGSFSFLFFDFDERFLVWFYFAYFAYFAVCFWDPGLAFISG
jgi:hypothetical protein